MPSSSSGGRLNLTRAAKRRGTRQTQKAKGNRDLLSWVEIEDAAQLHLVRGVQSGLVRASCSGRKLWVISASSGVVIPVRCGRWSCPRCGRWKAVVAQHFLAEGMKRWMSQGRQVRLLTLTAPAATTTERDISKAWNKLRTSLRAQRKFDAYAGVVERSPGRKRVHFHVLLAGTEYLPQARLSKQAKKAGFGRIVHITQVRQPDQAREYLTKAPGYLCKDLRNTQAKGTRSRPIKASRDWYPGGMRAAERDLIEKNTSGRKSERDPGPWIVFGIGHGDAPWFPNGAPDELAIHFGGLLAHDEGMS